MEGEKENEGKRIVQKKYDEGDQCIGIVVGNVDGKYLGDSETYNDSSAKEKMELYEILLNESNCEKIGGIDMEQLQQK